MKMSPAAVLDRVTGGRGALAIKYSMVSVIGVTITQVLLVLFVGILLAAKGFNVSLAALVGVIDDPSFLCLTLSSRPCALAYRHRRPAQQHVHLADHVVQRRQVERRCGGGRHRATGR